MHIFDQKCHRPGMPKHRYLRVEILISNVRARHKFFRLRSIVFMVCKHEYMDICNYQFPHMSAIDPSGPDGRGWRNSIKA